VCACHCRLEATAAASARLRAGNPEQAERSPEPRLGNGRRDLTLAGGGRPWGSVQRMGV
jgi:hypothetical protein